ncbi:MAG TPA: acyloxyacyl hydrolase [Thermoanaerobaculia bacterium]|nr:acyloxyacyl hydrolase [Thermoanaerobaculia bacterium]
MPTLRLHVRVLLILLVLLAVFGVPGAPAQEGGGWSASLGVIDFARSRQQLEIGITHRWPEWRWGLRPIAGVHVTLDETVFAYAGLRRRFRLGQTRWSFVPSLAVSLYQAGDGKDLGGLLEFRSGGDFLFDLPMGGRVGFGFYHLSNSGIHDRNPGTNSLLLRYQLPPRFR